MKEWPPKVEDLHLDIIENNQKGHWQFFGSFIFVLNFATKLEEEMDTIEPPSFCPSLGFTAASTERTESVGVVRGLLLWPSSLRPCVCRFAVRAGNQLTAHPC